MALDTLPKWQWAGEAVRSWLSKHGPNTGQYADRLTLPYLGSCGTMLRSHYGDGIEPPWTPAVARHEEHLLTRPFVRLARIFMRD